MRVYCRSCNRSVLVDAVPGVTPGAARRVALREVPTLADNTGGDTDRDHAVCVGVTTGTAVPASAVYLVVAKREGSPCEPDGAQRHRDSRNSGTLSILAHQISFLARYRPERFALTAL